MQPETSLNGATSKEKEPERTSSFSPGEYRNSFELDHSSESSSRRDLKGSFKSRGSIVNRVMQGRDASIARGSKSTEDPFEASRKKKKLPAKQISPDVMIPSIVSVENLSRILEVRLGKGTWNDPRFELI